ncbi:MAG: FkbM family methyltransferase [Verrucomicrobia bacterium]|nr:FkbM family methyltransferase [Verrucomicrobiota bacterium]
MFRQLLALWENRWFDNAGQLFFDRLLGRGTGLTVYRKGDYRILIDHRGEDQYGTRVCLTDGVYDGLLASLSLPRELQVLDLGANGGGFPLLLGLRGHTFRRLCCVEMNPNTFLRLSFNVHSNGFPDAVLLNAAVAPESGALERPFGLGSVSEAVGEGRGASGLTRRVPLLTLDEIARQAGFEGEIDLLKVDVEGAEYDVLLGAAATATLQRTRHLLIEFHDDARTPAVRQRLTELGFAAQGSHRQQYEVALFTRSQP